MKRERMDFNFPSWEGQEEQKKLTAHVAKCRQGSGTASQPQDTGEECKGLDLNTDRDGGRNKISEFLYQKEKKNRCEDEECKKIQRQRPVCVLGVRKVLVLEAPLF